MNISSISKVQNWWSVDFSHWKRQEFSITFIVATLKWNSKPIRIPWMQTSSWLVSKYPLLILWSQFRTHKSKWGWRSGYIMTIYWQTCPCKSMIFIKGAIPSQLLSDIDNDWKLHVYRYFTIHLLSNISILQTSFTIRAYTGFQLSVQTKQSVQLHVC